MHIPGKLLAVAVIPVAAIGAVAVAHGDASYTQLLAQSRVLAEPDYIRAGVPFIVHDNYATLICVSTHAGQPLEPFITPNQWPVSARQGHAPAYVAAGVPFTVQDRTSTQLCISSRSGEPIPPFIAPS